ncbi:MAG: hypothetical protein NZM42_11390, partial [Gemmatales bacterium]|nr:hypothetical protein [Gemmatales bacterium]
MKRTTIAQGKPVAKPRWDSARILAPCDSAARPFVGQGAKLLGQRSDRGTVGPAQFEQAVNQCAKLLGQRSDRGTLRPPFSVLVHR